MRPGAGPSARARSAADPPAGAAGRGRRSGPPRRRSTAWSPSGLGSGRCTGGVRLEGSASPGLAGAPRRVLAFGARLRASRAGARFPPLRIAPASSRSSAPTRACRGLATTRGAVRRNRHTKRGRRLRPAGSGSGAQTPKSSPRAGVVCLYPSEWGSRPGPAPSRTGCARVPAGPSALRRRTRKAALPRRHKERRTGTAHVLDPRAHVRMGVRPGKNSEIGLTSVLTLTRNPETASARPASHRNVSPACRASAVCRSTVLE